MVGGDGFMTVKELIVVGGIFAVWVKFVILGSQGKVNFFRLLWELDFYCVWGQK